MKNLSFQDTCVIESDGEKTFFVYDTIPAFSGGLCTWKRIDFDPVLGYCPLIALQKYGVKDGKLYSCGDGRWTERNMIPRQYIDSRKEGLTDDEFDVLDLPKDASVGDRMGGACWNSACMMMNCFSVEWRLNCFTKNTITVFR